MLGFTKDKQEAETGNWAEALVDRESTGDSTDPPTSKPSAPVPPVATNIYYLDITALLPDGTILPGLEAVIGSESRLWMDVNGKSVWIDAGAPYKTNLSISAKLGVTVRANNTLVPPSFW